MSYETITFEVEKGVGVLTLNRPNNLNAMNQTMIDEMLDVQVRVETDSTVNALVLCGAGRSFCAGYDLKEAYESGDERTIVTTRSMLQRDLDMTMGFWNCSKPTLSAIHGHCLAGGCELGLACDISIASEDAVFGEPELRFGAGIVCMILPWLTGPKQAKELIFTGNDKITAERALAIGLINKVVPVNEARDTAIDMARQIAVIDTEAMKLTKKAINRAYEIMGMRESLDAGVDFDVEISSLDTVENTKFKEITKSQGLKAAIAWRDSRFEG